ncbi:uncharacterized protein LOC112638332 isoform X1 [Camponotus floridanus]|uniref:uncharacterized protein LOC112638332 isoform X1 n=1 Tax=Camponotus floridanus TaxID=104421 RepID=UPI000DC66688|nr:uncharacterized protein LOC112638332 isoform X1 [Camponotus floridanus]
MVRFCCICKVEYGAIEDVSIHTIPKSKDLQVKWFLNIGRNVNKYSGVCSRHFEAKDFQYRVVGNIVKRFLIPEAVPTLLLTNCKNILNNDTEVITSSNQTTLLLAKTNDETSVLLHSHRQLQAKKDNSHTTLADVTNINLQDFSYSSVKAAEIENVKVTVSVEIKDNIEQLSLSNIHDIDNGNTNNAITEHKFHSEIVNDNCNEPNMPIDSECNNNMKQKTGLKRKSNEPMKNAKRIYNPRYIGDLRKQDFTSETSWRIVHEHVKTCKSRCRVFNKKIKRRNEKIENFKSLLNHLKKNSLLSNL